MPSMPPFFVQLANDLIQPKQAPFKTFGDYMVRPFKGFNSKNPCFIKN